MNYNDELQKLIKKQQYIINKAQKEGYRLINNELTKDKYIPVVEIYARGETQYEASGYYYVFKKTIPLNEEQINEIKSLEFDKTSLADFIEGDLFDDLRERYELNLFYEIINGGIAEEDIAYIVDKDYLEDRYCLEDGQNLYLEFFFKDDSYDGYISVFDMPINDLEQQEDINLFFTKYLKDN